ncbi:MAG: altronate dehydratase family protein [Bacteroidia bacterium]
MRSKILRVHPNDTVIVALADLAAGEQVTWDGVAYTLAERIQQKHKFTIHDLAPGDPVYMYGVLVGRATRHIPAGGWISTENLSHAADPYALRGMAYDWQAPDVSRWQGRQFMGYHRSDGRVGTANYWLVVPLVFCENRNLDVLRDSLLEPLGYGFRRHQLDIGPLKQLYAAGASPEALLEAELPSGDAVQRAHRFFGQVDGIKFLKHEGGCGGTRQDSEALCALLAGYINHPNVAGATVLSLGCQHAQVPLLEAALARIAPGFDKPLYIFEQQKSRSERDLLTSVIRQTFVGLSIADRQQRQPAPLSKLVLGLECGGSDGFSGISANPAVGQAADYLVALGGTAMLSEFPELCGVEQELSDRCISRDVSARFIQLMRAYEHAAEAVGSGFDMNPSPGNIRDGLITDAIKSAGAARKGGTSPITDVLDYTEQVRRPGLNLLCTPGNDVESTTALAGSGANLAVFTTGLGTPTGNPIMPVVKIATNTSLARRMADIIDIDAGTIITGEDSIETKGAEILDYLIRVASGEATPKAVQLGQDDFIPWKRGVSL